MKPTVGSSDSSDPEKRRRARLKPRTCKVDLSEDYDVFGNKHRPLEEVRRELGIPPLEPVAKAS